MPRSKKPIGGQGPKVPRFTKDLDLWIDPTLPNARRAIAALEPFGAPTARITAEDLATPEIV